MYERKLDTTYIIDTPEGIEIELAVAGPVARALAWATDFAIRCVFFIAIVIATQPFVETSSLFDSESAAFIAGFYSIIVFLLEWIYPTLCEAFTGTTPGKKLLKLRVVQDDGTPVTLPSSIIRNFLRAVDFLPLFYATGLVAMANNNAFKRLGDLAAGTLVIHTPRTLKTDTFTHSQALPLPGGLTTDERNAIVRFAERSSRLSTDRQIELANLLSDITGHTGTVGVNILKAWSHWIITGQEQSGQDKSRQHAQSGYPGNDSVQDNPLQGSQDQHVETSPV